MMVREDIAFLFNEYKEGCLRKTKLYKDRIRKRAESANVSLDLREECLRENLPKSLSGILKRDCKSGT